MGRSCLPWVAHQAPPIDVIEGLRKRTGQGLSGAYYLAHIRANWIVGALAWHRLPRPFEAEA